MSFKLRTKFMIVVLLGVGCVMAGGALFLQHKQQAGFEDQAKLRADMVLSFSKASRKYTKQTLRPRIQELTDDLVLEAMSGTFVTNHLMENFKESMEEFTYRQPTLNPLNEANRADDFERGLIEQFRADSEIASLDGYRTVDGNEYYFQCSPIIVEDKCLQCHSTPDVAPAGIVERYGSETGFGWIPGETIAATMITVPTDDLRADQGAMFKIVLGVFCVLLIAIVMLVRFFFSWFVSNRVGGFVDVMEDVADDPMSPLRTKPAGSDEISKVGRAFDSVADAFLEILTSLEDRVEERTFHLEHANSELDVAREEAEQASKSKSAFLANMSHEIRTPMAAIIGFSENILGEDISCEAKQEAAATIHRNGIHLLEIINDILDMSKIESGNMSIEQIDCDLIGLIRDVVSLVEIKASEKGIEMVVELSGVLPKTIKTDPTRLRQVLVNLLGNAIKFTKDGSVTLMCRRSPEDDQQIEFDVVDTGVGIPQEEQSKLFQAFVQADNSTTRKFGGTGLGLSISKQFAGMLGGDIAVVESVVDEGSRFRLRTMAGDLDGVELIQDPMSAYEKVIANVELRPEAEKSKTRSGIEGCRVLMAEDGPDNQKLISFVLRKAGAEVTIVENGQEAFDVMTTIGRDLYDVVLMDMQMPVLDGYSATAMLRDRGINIPILALTAHAMADDRQKCLDAGCDDYLTKPIDRKKMIETIRSYFGTKRAAA